MPLVFPSSPTTGQTFIGGGRVWVWTGTSWDSASPAQVAKGDPGAQGPAGATGPQGPAGAAGEALPAGSIVQWGSNTIPTNWLVCDGAAVSRSTFASLFAAIGTTYGAGDGTTTFNLPNLRGRVAVGRDASQTEFDVLGETGGAKTHTLTAAEMPSHTHTQDAHSHTFSATTSTNGDHIHQFDVTGAASGGGLNTVGGGAGGNLQTAAMRGAGNHTHTVSGTTANATATNQNTGGGGAHNNLQPYQVVNYIIKTSDGSTGADSALAARVGVLEQTVIPRTASATTGYSLLTVNYQNYISVTLTCTGRPVHVTFSAIHANMNSGANRTVSFRAQMDGATIGYELGGLFSMWLNGAAAATSDGATFILTPSAGTRTFTFQGAANNNSSCAIYAAQLAVFEV